MDESHKERKQLDFYMVLSDERVGLEHVQEASIQFLPIWAPIGDGYADLACVKLGGSFSTVNQCSFHGSCPTSFPYVCLPCLSALRLKKSLGSWLHGSGDIWAVSRLVISIHAQTKQAAEETNHHVLQLKRSSQSEAAIRGTPDETPEPTSR